MIDRSFTVRQWEYFVAVYRARSYAAAAKGIPISYQGLRKALSKLEAGLGRPLFVSDGGRLEPTPSADLVYDLALKWMHDMEKLEQAFESSQGRAEKTVIGICASQGALTLLGFDLIARFSERHPDLMLSVNEFSDKEADDLLEKGEYSLGVTVSPFSDRLVSEPIARAEPYAFVNRSNPLSKKDHLALADFDGECVMVSSENNKSFDFYRDAFEKCGVHPSSVIPCSGINWSYNHALRNQGIGTAHGMQVFEDLLQDDEVVFMPVRGGYVYEIAVSYRRGHVPTKREKMVIEFLREAGRP